MPGRIFARGQEGPRDACLTITRRGVTLALVGAEFVSVLTLLGTPAAIGAQGASPATIASLRREASSSQVAVAGDRALPTRTLGEIYRVLATNSPRVAAARAQARAALARVPSAKLPPDPVLQLGIMNRELPSLRQMDPLGMNQLQLTQMVPVAGRLRYAGRVAEAQAASASARADDVSWEQRGKAAMAFYEIYRSDSSIRVAAETQQLLRDIGTVAQSMYAVGDGRQADVLRAQVEVARMSDEITRMGAMRSTMGARLNALLDVPADAPVVGAALPLFPAELPPIDLLQAWALAARPMLLAGHEDVRAADAALRLAQSEIWPDLEVGVQYGQRTGTMGVNRMASFMIGASIPIYARQRQLKMREEASAMRSMAASDLGAMRADTRGRVAELYAELLRVRRLTALYRATVLPQSNATVSSSLAAYRVGGVNFMTLVDNQMNVNRYRQELISLQADEGKAWAELEMLVGRPLFDANVSAGPSAPAGGSQ